MSKILDSEEKSIDWGFLTGVLFLCALGLLMVYSSSSVFAMNKHGDSGYYLKRHAAYLAVGLGLMFTLMNINYRLLTKAVYPAYVLGIVLLTVVLIPGYGKEVGGARRWIDLGAVGFQPSEIAKFLLILYLAYSITKKKDKIETFTIGFFSHLFMAGLYIVLMLLEPDFGMATIVLVVLFGMLYVGGIKFRYLATSFGVSLIFIAWAIISQGYRLERILTFLNPWKDPLGSGYQVVQSFTALGLGGLWGSGLGSSIQKLFFLPEAHTDFIFSIMGEELGFIGVTAIIFVFSYLLLKGMKIANEAPDLFGTLLVFGTLMIITLQAATNMAVAVGLVPTKGLTLPLISYGGTSLVSSLGALGLVLSISRARV
ncbi:MAG: putative lipid II flippase FtsW [Candidatus Dadabacteria bacterium]|nr:putative lipid II flippase FtsW [Candidatus Dadabacteria bacterium]